ncbi:PRD domain-containing protein [Salisediminibacterium selenitireducens]|uniref:Transcriptional antiterminator, BglG n=1 Tax=Bacillus selenitireducens (strain ATCC 700615 / DSM 15326 / MLS10) TaxID=439292 RepID=D6XSY2_BACIE|nr:PRD domain-containing protein [Salisediminibacterium selenitireducens]ADH98918.1 transcriptional antiterminator, BglG [[Bacillus] selenitireducens MLS10]
MKDGTYRVVKALNNNVLIAKTDIDQEVIFIGKGIGFGKKAGHDYQASKSDKVYMLIDQDEQDRYKALVTEDNEERLLAVHEAIARIESEMAIRLPDSALFALTQHLALALQRTTDGTDIQNPFLLETKWLYRDSYRLAEQAVHFLMKETGLSLPEAEIGFVTLHIQSALRDSGPEYSNRNLEDVLERCLFYIEEKTGASLDERSGTVRRLISQISQIVHEPDPDDGENIVTDAILNLKQSDGLCYTVSRNVIRMIEKGTGKQAGDKDALHLMLALHSVMNHQQLTKP